MSLTLKSKSGWLSAGSITSWGYVAEVVDKDTGAVLGKGGSKRSKHAAQVKACLAANVKPSSFGVKQ